MPHALNNACGSQIIGGIFSSREIAYKAIEAFQDLDISPKNIQVIQLNGRETNDPCTSLLVERGFTHSQALYYDKAVQVGKVLVTVYEVTDLNPIIDIFSKYHAKYQLKHKQPNSLPEKL